MNSRLTRFLLGLVVLNAIVWVIWAAGSSRGGLPWPVWVGIASVAVASSRLAGGRRAAAGTGRNRNRNRNRDRG
jgi:hypothetical protein